MSTEVRKIRKGLIYKFRSIIAKSQGKKMDIMKQKIKMEEIYGDSLNYLHQKLEKREENNQIKFFEEFVCRYVYY